MTIKTGVIGCGNISQFHFSGLEKYGAKVKWVCDINKETAMSWAEKCDASYTADYADIINDPEVDAVFVTLPSALHKKICMAAIDAGKAVVCEKTLAENAEDALEIVKYADAANTLFFTSYMKRFIPAVEKAKELLPDIGSIMSTHIRAYQAWGNLWETHPQEGFFHTPPGGTSLVKKNYGGGILVCGGSHILDLILFFLGRPNNLYATVLTPEDRDYDIQAAALIETDNGIVHYEALAHPLHKIGFLRDGWDEKIEINGVNGRLDIYSANWTDVTTKASLLIHYDNATGNSTEYRFDLESPFDRAVAFFCKQIEEGKQGSQSRFTGYEVDELIATIKRSNALKQSVSLEWKV